MRCGRWSTVSERSLKRRSRMNGILRCWRRSTILFLDTRFAKRQPARRSTSNSPPLKSALAPSLDSLRCSAEVSSKRIKIVSSEVCGRCSVGLGLRIHLNSAKTTPYRPQTAYGSKHTTAEGDVFRLVRKHRNLTRIQQDRVPQLRNL